jgi:hypothetical protein
MPASPLMLSMPLPRHVIKKRLKLGIWLCRVVFPFSRSLLCVCVSCRSFGMFLCLSCSACRGAALRVAPVALRVAPVARLLDLRALVVRLLALRALVAQLLALRALAARSCRLGISRRAPTGLRGISFIASASRRAPTGLGGVSFIASASRRAPGGLGVARVCV